MDAFGASPRPLRQEIPIGPGGRRRRRALTPQPRERFIRARHRDVARWPHAAITSGVVVVGNYLSIVAPSPCMRFGIEIPLAGRTKEFTSLSSVASVARRLPALTDQGPPTVSRVVDMVD